MRSMCTMRLHLPYRAITCLSSWITKVSSPGSSRYASSICCPSITNWTWRRSSHLSLCCSSACVWETPVTDCSCSSEQPCIVCWLRISVQQWNPFSHWYRYWPHLHSSADCWQVRSSERISTISTCLSSKRWKKPCSWTITICSNCHWYSVRYRFCSVWCWKL